MVEAEAGHDSGLETPAPSKRAHAIGTAESEIGDFTCASQRWMTLPEAARSAHFTLWPPIVMSFSHTKRTICWIAFTTFSQRLQPADRWLATDPGVGFSA